MRRTPTRLLRRAVMWAAGVVLGLSVAAWVVSLWGVQWDMGRTEGPAIWFLWGEVQAFSTKPIDRPGWHTNGLEWPTRNSPQWRHMLWVSRLPEGGFRVGLQFPLWMPATAAGTILWSASRVGRRTRDRVRAGCCAGCGYDLTGITGPCPECGKEQKA